MIRNMFEPMDSNDSRLSVNIKIIRYKWKKTAIPMAVAVRVLGIYREWLEGY